MRDRAFWPPPRRWSACCVPARKEIEKSPVPLGDDDRRVGVGMDGVTAGHAVKLGLGLAVVGGGVMTAGALPRSICRGHLHDDLAAAGGLVAGVGDDFAEGGVEQRLVEPGLGGGPVRGESAGARPTYRLRAPSHVAQIDSLERDELAVRISDHARNLMGVVVAKDLRRDRVEPRLVCLRPLEVRIRLIEHEVRFAIVHREAARLKLGVLAQPQQVIVLVGLAVIHHPSAPDPLREHGGLRGFGVEEEFTAGLHPYVLFINGYGYAWFSIEKRNK